MSSNENEQDLLARCPPKLTFEHKRNLLSSLVPFPNPTTKSEKGKRKGMGEQLQRNKTVLSLL